VNENPHEGLFLSLTCMATTCSTRDTGSMVLTNAAKYRNHGR